MVWLGVETVFFVEVKTGNPLTVFGFFILLQGEKEDVFQAVEVEVFDVIACELAAILDVMAGKFQVVGRSAYEHYRKRQAKYFHRGASCFMVLSRMGRNVFQTISATILCPFTVGCMPSGKLSCGIPPTPARRNGMRAVLFSLARCG